MGRYNYKKMVRQMRCIYFSKPSQTFWSNTACRCIYPSMEIQNHNRDLSLAQRICHELRSGNREALSELHKKYQPLFTGFTRQRLYDSWDYPIEHVLSDFWVELLDGKAICNYKADASLRTYLSVILGRRIIDANRKIKREKTSGIAIEDQRHQMPDKDYLQQSPESDLIKKELQKCIHEALLQLAQVSPRDASLIRMHFEGMTYKEMAERELQGVRYRPRKLKKKIDAIKKQFTRPKTGSMAKFGKILNQILEKNGLNHKDLLNSFPFGSPQGDQIGNECEPVPNFGP